MHQQIISPGLVFPELQHNKRRRSDPISAVLGSHAFLSVWGKTKELCWEEIWSSQSGVFLLRLSKLFFLFQKKIMSSCVKYDCCLLLFFSWSVSALPLLTALSCNKPAQNCTKSQLWLVQTVRLLKFDFSTGSDMTRANSSAWYLGANITSLVVWLQLLLFWTRFGSVVHNDRRDVLRQPHVSCSGTIWGQGHKFCTSPRSVSACMDVQTQASVHKELQQKGGKKHRPSTELWLKINLSDKWNAGYEKC